MGLKFIGLFSAKSHESLGLVKGGLFLQYKGAKNKMLKITEHKSINIQAIKTL